MPESVQSLRAADALGGRRVLALVRVRRRCSGKFGIAGGRGSVGFSGKAFLLPLSFQVLTCRTSILLTVEGWYTTSPKSKIRAVWTVRSPRLEIREEGAGQCVETESRFIPNGVHQMGCESV